MNIDLNQDQTAEEPKVLTNNDIIQQLSNNPYLQQDLRRVDEGQTVNMELADEILAILRENEGTLFDSTQQERYLNYETAPIAYNILRRAGETEPARLIKNKRRLDLSQFGKYTNKAGNRGVKLSFRNPDYQPTREEKLILREWELKLIDNLFYPTNDHYPNFAKFIGMAYEDWFDVDDITLEFRLDGFGRPVAIHLQDPIIYKPVVKRPTYSKSSFYDDVTEILNDYSKIFDTDEYKEKKEAEVPDYLLVYNNQRIAGVTREKVRKFHFFSRSDFRKADRGYSVIEQGIRLVTNIMNAIQMNASNFTNNRLPSGFFAFTGGGVNQLALEKLKKTMYAYQTGATNTNRYPMMSLSGDKSDAKWIGTRGNSKDVEFHQFMTLLFSVFCQLSGTDPREVSMGSYGDAIGKSTLFSESTDGIVKQSKDAGAQTFLEHLADSLNSPNKDGKNVFQIITSMDVRLEFTGFSVEDLNAKAQLIEKELASTKSINDLLALDDVEKKTLMLGDKNVYDVTGFHNPQIYQTLLFNAQQQAQQQAQQAQQTQGAPMGGMPQGAPQDGEQPQGLTDKDKALMSKFSQGGQDENNIDNELQTELSQGETENNAS